MSTGIAVFTLMTIITGANGNVTATTQPSVSLEKCMEASRQIVGEPDRKTNISLFKDKGRYQILTVCTATGYS